LTINDTYVVVLAAGKGTRMKSKLSKMLHPVCGKPMVKHVLDAAQAVNPEQTYVIVGHDAQTVQHKLGDGFEFVQQKEQLGTGHAVMQVKPFLQDKSGQTLVMLGDTPLIKPETIQQLLSAHKVEQAALTVLTTLVDDPTGYGRVIRDKTGGIKRIVEQKDATPDQLSVREINTGICCFDNEILMQALDGLSNDNAQQEYYLLDCIEELVAADRKVTAHRITDSVETMGVNDRVALAQAEKQMRKRLHEQLMLDGVTFIDPERTYVDADVQIGPDTVLYPGTMIKGGTSIGEGCEIGPHTEMIAAVVGNGCHIKQSTIQDSSIGDNTTVGPYAYVRPGCKVENGCKIGTYVEIKNASIKEGAKIPHLSYVGDADIGAGVNMSCGSITVNYDGHQKHRTVVEDSAFVGCNANLVAPVTVGKGAYVAAGSTITDSVPADSLAIARERQTTKENYVPKLKAKQLKAGQTEAD
jgi:bifunctional UDP-N-acetylglucosamine pyrophosphorylase / glucosamine-1-phosphate N-acetyltransferase